VKLDLHHQNIYIFKLLPRGIYTTAFEDTKWAPSIIEELTIPLKRSSGTHRYSTSTGNPGKVSNENAYLSN